jgi:hypothetical protein
LIAARVAKDRVFVESAWIWKWLAVPLLRQSANASPQQLTDQTLFTFSPRGKTISGQAISICGDTQMLG